MVTRGEGIRRVKHGLTGDREIYILRGSVWKSAQLCRLVHDEGLTMSLM